MKEQPQGGQCSWSTVSERRWRRSLLLGYWGSEVDYTGDPKSLLYGFYSQMVSYLNGDIDPVLFQKDTLANVWRLDKRMICHVPDER